MILESYIWYIVAGIGIIILYMLIRGYISIYNKFQYWFAKAQRKFADIDVIMQERLDKIHALAQMVKKYDIHEYKTLTDVIGARSRWNKNMDLNEKVKVASQTENNFLKIQAVFERYPKLKAEALHANLMAKGSYTEIKLRRARLSYNHVAQNYNQRVKQFPRNIVAKIHGFKTLNYLDFAGQEKYNPKEIFEE